MKVFAGSYDLEGKRLTLQFTSEDRVDFRDLVRDVSAVTGCPSAASPGRTARPSQGRGRLRSLRTTPVLLVLAYLVPRNFHQNGQGAGSASQSIQDSWQCGRLLCCLSYENEMYREVKQSLPRPGTYLSTPTGNARVLAVNVPREVITMQMETMEIRRHSHPGARHGAGSRQNSQRTPTTPGRTATAPLAQSGTSGYSWSVSRPVGPARGAAQPFTSFKWSPSPRQCSASSPARSAATSRSARARSRFRTAGGCHARGRSRAGRPARERSPRRSPPAATTGGTWAPPSRTSIG